MDVICVVNTVTGALHCTEFYVKFKSTLIEEGTAALLGLSNDGTSQQSSSVFPNEQGEAERQALEDFIAIIPPPELDWVDILCNKHKCEGVIAFIGPQKILHFYDPITQNYSVTPTESMMQCFNLEMGKNQVVCWHRATGVAKEFNIWKFEANDKLVIMDIDGTITKSDITGYITTVYLGMYSHVHDGVVTFLNVLKESYGYNFVYLSSRPMIHRKETKQLLENIRDEFGLSMPDGPLFTNKERILHALYREITKNTVEFKSTVLGDIASVFKAAGCRGICPYVLGIGNKEMDAVAYNSVGLPAECILVIDPSSQICVWKYSTQIKKTSLLRSSSKNSNNTWIVDCGPPQSSYSPSSSAPAAAAAVRNDSRIQFTTDEGNEDDTVEGDFNQADAATLATTAEGLNNSYKVKFSSYKDENLLRYITRVATDQRCNS